MDSSNNNIDRSNYTDLKLEDINEKITELFYNRVQEPIPDTLPSIVHREWEEDGRKYSVWEIRTGRGFFITGDAGKKMFDDAVKDWVIGKTKLNYDDKATEGVTKSKT